MKYYKETRTYMIEKILWEVKDLQIGYEEKYDILGIIIPKRKYKIEKTVEVDAGFLIDVDKNNKIVQIEIHNICNRINENKKYVQEAKIQVYVDSYEYSYLITIDFNDGEHKIKQRILK